MAKSAVAGGSIADMNARKAAETPVEIEVETSFGWLIFLQIIGSHSDTIRKIALDMEDENRRTNAQLAWKNSKARPEKAEIIPISKEIDKGDRITAKRIVGWRGPNDTQGLTPDQLERFWGITDPFSFEAALELVRGDSKVALTVVEQSDDIGLFTKRSQPAS